jgi:hypothetical protein
MSHWKIERLLGTVLIPACMVCTCCAQQSSPIDENKAAALAPGKGEDPEMSKRGRIEVTAKLVEIPEGAIFQRELYDYATVLKYQVQKVHRGQLGALTIYVGHYNPFKPRAGAADQRVQGIGGDLKAFRAGQLHRMALEEPIDDYFMGGIVDKYFGKKTDPIYWAVRTNLVSE